MSFPPIFGVGRDGDDDRVLRVVFERRPSDSEMRAFHDSVHKTRPADGMDLAAAAGAPDHADAIRLMLPNVLIVLLSRLGGKVVLSVDEIDGTADRVVAMQLVGRTFHFTVGKKQ